VVLAAGEHPVQRVHAQGPADVGDAGRHREGRAADVDEHLRRPRDVPQVGQQAVGHVDHGGGAGAGGLGTRA
jgi:hypothetical protein